MWRVPIVGLLFITFFTPVLRAQSTSASLAGRVTDSSKARIAGAKVVAINVDTNVSDEATTNAAGEYYLRSLVPGTYRIEVEKPGFKKLIKPDVILHVQDTLGYRFRTAGRRRVGSTPACALLSILNFSCPLLCS